MPTVYMQCAHAHVPAHNIYDVENITINDTLIINQTKRDLNVTVQTDVKANIIYRGLRVFAYTSYIFEPGPNMTQNAFWRVTKAPNRMNM